MSLNINESELQEIRRTMQSSWVAGCIENFNLVKVEVAENYKFSSTCWRFLLWQN